MFTRQLSCVWVSQRKLRSQLVDGPRKCFEQRSMARNPSRVPPLLAALSDDLLILILEHLVEEHPRRGDTGLVSGVHLGSANHELRKRLEEPLAAARLSLPPPYSATDLDAALSSGDPARATPLLREAMRRVKHNVELIASRLLSKGFPVAVDCAASGRPYMTAMGAEAVEQHASGLHERGGRIPLALQIFWEELGGVALASADGSHNDWWAAMHPEVIEEAGTMFAPDPLWLGGAWPLSFRIARSACVKLQSCQCKHSHDLCPLVSFSCPAALSPLLPSLPRLQTTVWKCCAMLPKSRRSRPSRSPSVSAIPMASSSAKGTCFILRLMPWRSASQPSPPLPLLPVPTPAGWSRRLTSTRSCCASPRRKVSSLVAQSRCSGARNVRSSPTCGSPCLRVEASLGASASSTTNRCAAS